MQRWLRDRHEMVPAGDATHDMMPDGSHPHARMLTPQQLMQLGQRARHEFDRLFLVFMIQHHTGAITMVTSSSGRRRRRGEIVFRFASDVYADQTTEIARSESHARRPQTEPLVRFASTSLSVIAALAPWRVRPLGQARHVTTAPVPDRRRIARRANRTPRKRSGT